ncbi:MULTISPECIES: VraH family protein [unclassified Staphylococcus]|uniref:VraH family peptide resistance protein n=1 Tax=unclassified Staphylococcus TaxID=91994 RepID=UPI0021D2187B|nr:MULTISPECIES: VraH family protein [unclassified Staphylococcus]UXR69467.1 VraH family protein [Staphylococcus sp. IVB6246]UXR71522.1 VraH family protein [Staphylococcus sp. IVB6240]UXR80316.1 VraH family protein [Staphylococcus sp. IVB6218]
MRLKDILSSAYHDLLNMKINAKNVIITTLITFFASSIMTPLLGIPVGLLFSGWLIENKLNN